MSGVHCDCGDCEGFDYCEWWGPTSETVIIEYMPEQFRASHADAGNSGSYPHNGAIRVRVARSCADRLADDWCREVQV